MPARRADSTGVATQDACAARIGWLAAGRAAGGGGLADAARAATQDRCSRSRTIRRAIADARARPEIRRRRRRARDRGGAGRQRRRSRARASSISPPTRHVALEPATGREGRTPRSPRPPRQRHTAASFARGLVTGEPDDMAALAGTALGDLFVFGDIRDAVREGAGSPAARRPTSWCSAWPASASRSPPALMRRFGAAAPARVGLTLAKAARKTGGAQRRARRLGRPLAARRGRLGRAEARRGRRSREPAVAVRAAREAVKVERAGGLVHLARDVGRVQEQGRHAGRARRPQDRREAARDGAPRAARREGRRQDPRHSEGGRPRRASALVGAAFDLAMLDSGRAAHCCSASSPRSRARPSA